MSDEQKAFIDYYSRPASDDCIQGYLLRLAIHKHVKGDEMQKTLIIEDTVQSLRGIKELDLWDLCEKYLNEDESGFFPQISFFKKNGAHF